MQRLLFFLLFVTLILNSSCGKKLSEKEKTEILTFTEMSDLATVEYTLSKIVKANDKSAWYTIGNRKIAMSVTAYAKAGIDLSQITTGAITDDKNGITIQLPPSKLISLSIPPEEIKEEMVEIGSLRKSFTNDEKNELLKQAEVEIRHSLDSIGILTKAEQQAKRFIESFVKDLGHKKVNVVITKANPQ